MKYGIELPNAGPCGDARTLAELAALAEAAGWDGIFLEDYIVHWSGQNAPTYDPWVALTAMALMFAIFQYRPSPFCLLDEIDAPLDDANVGRFVEMLRGMLDRTQFILITHNRRTMEIANRLYGVTMEEPGVSKLISVQLH